VSKGPRCVVGCHSSSINVNELDLMCRINSFGLMTWMPQIYEKETLGGKLLKQLFM